jgi:hypothetical protein
VKQVTDAAENNGQVSIQTTKAFQTITKKLHLITLSSLSAEPAMGTGALNQSNKKHKPPKNGANKFTVGLGEVDSESRGRSEHDNGFYRHRGFSQRYTPAASLGPQYRVCRRCSSCGDGR